MDILQAKKNYNKILERINKAEMFFSTCSNEEADKHLPTYIKLIEVINGMVIGFKESGAELTDTQIIEGFKGISNE